MANIQTQSLQNFIVMRDGQVDEELSHIHKTSPLQGLVDRASLQVEMFIYDQLHRTNYRRIRNQLVREQHNREFEARLGLIPANKKTARG